MLRRVYDNAHGQAVAAPAVMGSGEAGTSDSVGAAASGVGMKELKIALAALPLAPSGRHTARKQTA